MVVARTSHLSGYILIILSLRQMTLTSSTMYLPSQSISVQVAKLMPTEWKTKRTQGKNRAGGHSHPMSALAQPRLKSDFLLLDHVRRQKNLMIKLFAGAQVWSFKHQLGSHRYVQKEHGIHIQSSSGKATIWLFQDMCGIQGATQAINNLQSPLVWRALWERDWWFMPHHLVSKFQLKEDSYNSPVMCNIAGWKPWISMWLAIITEHVQLGKYIQVITLRSTSLFLKEIFPVDSKGSS